MNKSGPMPFWKRAMAFVAGHIVEFHLVGLLVSAVWCGCVGQLAFWGFFISYAVVGYTVWFVTGRLVAWATRFDQRRLMRRANSE